MAKQPIKDIVVDTNVIRLYNNPADPLIRAFFFWIANRGTLTVSQRLLVEYCRIGKRDIAALIDRLTRNQRLNPVSAKDLQNFVEDRHHKYTCNFKDTWHARLVFLSIRKRLVGGDKRLINDVNGFKKINGIKPQATKSPRAAFYE
jgi:hypothetical protein